MVACKKCKKEIPEGALYCPWCGSPQKRNKKKKMYQRPDGLFEQVKMIDGKRVYFRGKTEKEVTDKMIAYQEEKERGPLFRDVAEACQEEHYQRIAYQTRRGYDGGYEPVINGLFKPFFKHYCVLSVNAEHIQKIYMLEVFPSGRSFFKLFFKNLLTKT